MDRRRFIRYLAGCAAGGLLAACESADEPRFPYDIDPDTCRGCGLCMGHCKKDAIQLLFQSSYVVDYDACPACKECYDACPYDAITLEMGDFGKAEIDQDKCQHCGECYLTCRYQSIKGVFHRATILQNYCTHCGECIELEFCPYDAIYSYEF